MFLIAWLIFIIYASLSPSDKVPELSFIPHFDKIAHFCMYFGLSFLLVPIVLNKHKLLRNYLLVFIIAAGIGIVFELLQYYMAIGRTSSVYDEIANATGAITGIIAYHIIMRNKKLEKVIFKIE